VSEQNWYHEQLMDHYRHPRHSGSINSPDFCSDSFNPSCGDSVQFMGNVTDVCISDIAFTGSGCVISQAASSMLAERVKGKSISEVLSFKSEEMVALVGLKLGPNRMRCALLCLEALQAGLQQYVKQQAA
jgi:nitrogen fixation protein NifU and related proteins